MPITKAIADWNLRFLGRAILVACPLLLAWALGAYSVTSNPPSEQFSTTASAPGVHFDDQLFAEIAAIDRDGMTATEVSSFGAMTQSSDEQEHAAGAVRVSHLESDSLK